MAERVTLTIDTEEDLHRALVLRAAREGGSVGDVVTRVLRQALTAELEELAGRPPLADIIQAHHDRRLREQEPPAGPAP
jgi:plasmid stability protein